MNLNSLYQGIVLNNSDISDVENERPRGRVKVLIKGISITSSDGDIYGPMPVGKNIDETVSPKTKELVDNYEIWADVLAPVTGGGGSLARYNASSDLAIISDVDFPTNTEDLSPAENYTNITISDGYTDTGTGTAAINPNGNSYTPDNRTNCPKGWFAMPNVGDTVLVGFINSSRGLPVILGILHSGTSIESINGIGVAGVWPNYPLGNNIV
jgi:hypothetical protein|tara:strand:+ start:420 stop:1055 length:636 start_codon:yes stop_codon:yes gene_type:complete